MYIHMRRGPLLLEHRPACVTCCAIVGRYTTLSVAGPRPRADGEQNRPARSNNDRTSVSVYATGRHCGMSKQANGARLQAKQLPTCVRRARRGRSCEVRSAQRSAVEVRTGSCDDDGQSPTCPSP
ncbi:uncharacterized protein PSFLO_05778 [Pseudozyma flocculosa]|uniref:Uncharacterized protein n=1 Tax=Pseudozyma flocculosa TaxID=84751 RepID=A0A5C3F8B0_9BASI|nr:uncharacterized protein PSFLO_05778 [Pseudozyma flocculosa]